MVTAFMSLQYALPFRIEFCHGCLSGRLRVAKIIDRDQGRE